MVIFREQFGWFENMLVSLHAFSNIAGNNMARQIRKKSGTGICHVMLRGVNCQDIFGDDEDQILDIDTDGDKSVSDSDVRVFLQTSQGIANSLMFQSLVKTRLNEVLRYALSFGTGVRQLSR